MIITIHALRSEVWVKIMERMKAQAAVILLLLCLTSYLEASKVRGESTSGGFKAGEPKTKHCKAGSYNDNGWWSHCSGMIKCPKYCPDCHLSCKYCGMSYCPKCNKIGSICQDPRFIGGDGVMFYFHGTKDSDYCLLSDTNLHINAHFIGKRPSGRPRDFTWVQSLGILFHTHKLYIGARKTASWNATSDRFLIYLDGKAIALPQKKGSTWPAPAPAASPPTDGSQNVIRFTRLEDANSINVAVAGVMNATVEIVPITREESRVHRYEISSDDCMAHLEVAVEFEHLTESVAGVLGQTYSPHWHTPIRGNTPMPTLGDEHKYVASAILTPDCPVAKFMGIELAASEAFAKHSPIMLPAKCGGGPGGFGLACRK